MSCLPFDRLFSMSAFNALRSIRIQARISTGMDTNRLVELVKKLDPDAISLDFEAAIELNSIVAADASVDNAHEFYRACIYTVIISERLSWAKAVTLGRDVLLRQINRDEHQCFRSARLLETPPSDDVVSWWDTISAQMRMASDQERGERARFAEKLSFENEKVRLKSIGIDKVPQWVSIDDNRVGYDILSFERGAFDPVNKLIEVKSTIASPLRFIVTRNEWETALRFGASYVFHIWDLTAASPRLFERTVAQVQPHIPQDNEKGKWKSAEIPVGGGN